MNCCICTGNCNHVGPHSYCPRHAGPAQTPVLAPNPPFPSPLLRTTQEMCNHCFCEESHLKPNHRLCCKCADTMHERFIPEPKVKFG